MNSLYLVAAIMAFSSVVIPQASQFVWGFYQVYLSMVMCHFVDITMDWYGGGSEMVIDLSESSLQLQFQLQHQANYNIRPHPTLGMSMHRSSLVYTYI